MPFPSCLETANSSVTPEAMPGNFSMCVQAEIILTEARRRLGFHSHSEEETRTSLLGFEGILAMATGLMRDTVWFWEVIQKREPQRRRKGFGGNMSSVV